MKIHPIHMAALRTGIAEIDTEARRARYRAGNYMNAAQTKDLDRRYRWDLMWDLPVGERRALVNTMYEYLNDAHIDTALRAIVPML